MTAGSMAARRRDCVRGGALKKMEQAGQNSVGDMVPDFVRLGWVGGAPQRPGGGLRAAARARGRHASPRVSLHRGCPAGAVVFVPLSTG